MKIGRNQACSCGSGKKYKRCCGDPLKAQGQQQSRVEKVPLSVLDAIPRMEAREHIRKQQQGLGRPIVSWEDRRHRIVAVGNTVHFSPRWKVFTDFLEDYIKKVMGSEWGTAEMAKPAEQRHPLMKWFDGYVAFKQQVTEKTGELYSAPASGVVYCYLGLAYNLYLISHNVELQDRLVRRLRDPHNFQGAYYELIVANCLIRAGFKLELEDEADNDTKHCEFSAVSTLSGRKYWVEAKMRSVAGLLGKDIRDGATSDHDPSKKITEHVAMAFQKPAADERLIFVDVNGPPATESVLPRWAERAADRLDAREKDTPDHQAAYVFVTNFAFHRSLDAVGPNHAALAYGLNIPDFAKPGEYRLIDMYRAKQKHLDAYRIMDAIRDYPKLPTTFDGSLLSDAIVDGRPRIEIGRRYFFEDIEEKGILATVTTATVLEKEKKVYIGVTTEDGRNLILTESMTDAQLTDYRAHPDAYFGVIRRVSRNSKDAFDLFEWMVESYKKTPKQRLIELAKGAPDLARLAELDRDSLALELCERWTASFAMQNSNAAAASGLVIESTSTEAS